ncbi:arylsulfatase B [Rhipicephalus sanguineus]|uniref:arylsulfatase B n=1 Tax=Rhipicephalus sanguineus TaxID=34632 RepID=UPI0018955D66|nr:arylsulfatase B [Rhipicephalus sanguineus]
MAARCQSRFRVGHLRGMLHISLVFACATNASARDSRRSPPHIVFLLADDLGWGDVSFHGSPQIPTPNIDALANTGVVLNNHYMQPTCSPSRGALLSGRYCIHIGFQEKPLLPRQRGGLSLDVKIMPEYFKDLGYESHILGKWHLGYFSFNYTPTYRGFDSFVGMHVGPTDYYTHVLKWDGLKGLDFWDDTEPLTTENGTYATNLFTERAKSIIANRDKSKPMFLYFAHQATHGGVGPEPIEAPAENVAKFPYIHEDARRVYAGMTDALDQSVGILLEALEEASMLRDTIIVFSSDNGGAPTGPISNRGINWPLRGTKTTLWEGGIRSPAFLWTPELLPRRRVSQQLMHATDWLPTLYSAAGGDVDQLPSMDGFDMWRALIDGEASPRSEILININRQAGEAALRYRDWKLVLGDFGELDERFEIPGGSRPYEGLDEMMCNSKAAAVLKRLYGREDVFEHASQWRQEATITCGDDTDANFSPGGSRYLFDVSQDPCELHNLAEERPEILSMLLEKLEGYNETVVPPVDDTLDPRGAPEYHDGVWAPWVH